MERPRRSMGRTPGQQVRGIAAQLATALAILIQYCAGPSSAFASGGTIDQATFQTTGNHGQGITVAVDSSENFGDPGVQATLHTLNAVLSTSSRPPPSVDIMELFAGEAGITTRAGRFGLSASEPIFGYLSESGLRLDCLGPHRDDARALLWYVFYEAFLRGRGQRGWQEHRRPPQDEPGPRPVRPDSDSAPASFGLSLYCSQCLPSLRGRVAHGGDGGHFRDPTAQAEVRQGRSVCSVRIWRTTTGSTALKHGDQA